MHCDVQVTDLGSLLGGWTVNVIGAKLSENARLQCAGEPRYSSRVEVRATQKDHDRWYGATEDLLTTIHALQDKEELISLHKYPPFRGRLWWHLRHAKRNWLLRKDYDANVAELQAEFSAALATYQKQAGDLPAYITRFKKQEQKRIKDEKEQARLRRAEAMKSATDPLWSYHINSSSGGRSFWIYLTSLDQAKGNAGLTPVEVQSALAAERAEYPYTSVMWGIETRQALKEKYETEASGWKALTDEVIILHPHDPSKPQYFSKYHGGPSSTYGSDGGGGYGGFGGSY